MQIGPIAIWLQGKCGYWRHLIFRIEYTCEHQKIDAKLCFGDFSSALNTKQAYFLALWLISDLILYINWLCGCWIFWVAESRVLFFWLLKMVVILILLWKTPDLHRPVVYNLSERQNKFSNFFPMIFVDIIHVVVFVLISFQNSGLPFSHCYCWHGKLRPKN